MSNWSKLIVLASTSLVSFACFAGSPEIQINNSLPEVGWYIGVFAGPNIMPSKRGNSTVNGVNTFHQTDFEIGGQGGLSGGYRYGAFAIEGEASYFYNSLQDLRSANVSLGPVRGHLGMVMGTVNVYYQFLNICRNVIPYVGVGIGAVGLHSRYTTQTVRGSNSNTAFAYQGIAGIQIPIGSVFSAFIDYRFVGATHTNYILSNAGTTLRFGESYYTHSINLGVVAFI